MFRGPVIDAQYETINETSHSFSDVLADAFNWMALGLLITALVSFFVASNPSLIKMFLTSGMFYVLILAELGLVFFISARIMKLDPSTALSMFFIYSALNGVTMASIFIVYTSSSIATTFMVTAAMFGVMAFLGKNTNKDLSNMGNIMFMGLIGIIIASVVNIFLKSPAVYWLITYAGVVVFCGLTAWDVQKIRAMEQHMPGNEKRIAIFGALTLYLDFINLFLMLLRILGGRRD